MKTQPLPTARLAELFQHFQKVLRNNTALMERIAELEGALGGAFIFDRVFIEQAARDLVRLVREVIYSLNALSGNRYTPLYDRLEAIAAQMGSITLGGPTPEERRVFLPASAIHRDLDMIVGGKAAILGEIGNHLQLSTPDGFALTTTAYVLFMERNRLFQQFAAICRERDSARERSARMTELLQAAIFPKVFQEAVAEGLAGLRERQGGGQPLAVRSSAVGEDGLRSFAGQFGSELNVVPEVAAVLAACRRVFAARFSERVLDYAGEAEPQAIPMATLVQEMIPASFSGILQSQAPWRGSDRILVTAVAGNAVRLADGALAGNHYVLERSHPFNLVESEFAHESDRQDVGSVAGASDGASATGLHAHSHEIVAGGFRRGSSPLSLPLLRQLAEIAVLLEKALNGPQEIEWAVVGETVYIIQSRPCIAMAVLPPPPKEVAADLRRATVLLHGHGHAAQIGIASGSVVPVAPGDDPAHFPVGAIAVARQASPALSPFVRKAAAVITDVGGPTGHLAAICREYRTPALFGTGVASRILPPGTEVTVDVEERTVYAGLVPGLLRLAAARQDPHLLSAEAVTLRRLLRLVAPLSLTDPSAPEFTPAHCRTLHDLIRFCHEKAVESLMELQTGDGVLPSSPLRLAVAIPLRLHLLDLGGGIAPEAPSHGDISPEMIRSRPFAALLTGLIKESAWDRVAAPFSMKDLLSSMSRPLANLLNQPPYEGENLAILAANYCNLSLRLGYHFNVIDSYISERPEENTIYFRFVGGFATEDKRRRRAELIASILRGLHFSVVQKGDLVVARTHMLDAGEMEQILTRIGELIAFTRQLDVRMVDENAVEDSFEQFLARITRREEG